ncbi:hypothetical protein A8F94_11800 [Bacillus sp. FJAT-27225]|nr:hypothetical protein [Bacillus sp. FJAT-27225]OCA85564.1 hypothetical protein A8F94_11800 [Bacillus sp. FJAT-27225]
MKIALFSPYYNQPRGNSTTVKRLIYHFEKMGILLSVIPYLENSSIDGTDADIFHILHATRFVRWAKDRQFILNHPYIVTMGGTDINVDLQTDLSSEIFSFLNEAVFITVFTEDAKDKIKQLYSPWMKKTFVIPQGVWLPWAISSPKNRLKPSILLPAGLRPVKDVLHILPGLDEIIDHYPEMTFTILGANLDRSVHRDVLKQAEHVLAKIRWCSPPRINDRKIRKRRHYRQFFSFRRPATCTNGSDGVGLASHRKKKQCQPATDITRKNRLALRNDSGLH